VTIHFAPQAEADFAAVIGFIAERDPHAATEFGQRIFAVVDKLASGEFDGPEQL
jgi:plasmid stabilization system protein ParE